ncbi:MAG: peptide deformylase [Gemmatimonadaceae bacterium]|nr:peptide deformylase [Gemmatimonadaceae bacterium]
MSILDIRVLGDPILRKETVPVAEITDELRKLIADMFETMYASEGIGLAAPQVGRSERIAVVDVDGERHVLINPEIAVRSSRTDKSEEGCLSIPNIYGDVTRPSTVTVSATNEKGEDYEVTASDLLGRCLQHEIDHLDGKLFIDYLSMLKRRSALNKWEDEKSDYPDSIRKVIAGKTVGRKSGSRSEHPEEEM